MSTCDQFPYGTRKYHICNGTIDMPLQTINKFRVLWGWEPLAEKPETLYVAPVAAKQSTRVVPMQPVRRPNSSRPQWQVEQPGTRLKAKFAKWNAQSCPICEGLAAQMDQLGAAGCRVKLDELVADIHERGKEWFAKHFPKLNGLIVFARSETVRDIAIRLEIKRLLWQSIRETEAAQEEAKKKLSLPPDLRRRRVGVVEAGRAYREAIANPPTETDPFTEPPTIHFGAHLWARPKYWKWHINKWNELSNQINGRLIVFVATDSETDSVDTIREALNPRFEVIEIPNTVEGENPSFRNLQEMIPSGPNDILIYAHGKGVKKSTCKAMAVKLWTRMMYDTVTFNIPQIIQKLSAGYRTFGSFRAFGRYPHSPKYEWHYAGTFFAIRAKYIQEAPVVYGYGGVEAWPGSWCPPNLAWCEFADNRVILSHYKDAVMAALKEDQFSEWKKSSQRKSRQTEDVLLTITTYNPDNREDIRTDIERLLRSVRRHFRGKALIVDDGSGPEYVQFLKSLCIGFNEVLFLREENGGCAEAKNDCIAYFLSGSWKTLILLDDDVEILSDNFTTEYAEALSKVPILSFNDPSYTKTAPAFSKGLSVSDHTCGVCVVLSREAALVNPRLPVYKGKWGHHHIHYYSQVIGEKNLYYDVPDSSKLIRIASNASVYTDEQKKSCLELIQRELAQN